MAQTNVVDEGEDFMRFRPQQQLVHRAFLLRAAALIANLCLAAAVSVSGQTIENDRVLLTFDSDHGSLTHLVDKQLGHDFVAGPSAAALWHIVLADPKGQSILPALAKSFTFQPSGPGNTSLVLEWSQFDLPSLPGLCVTATVTLEPGSPLSMWRVRAEGLSGRSIKSLHFPCISPITRQDHEVLAVPVWIGERSSRPRELVHDSKGTPRRVEWQYPGILSMQWITLYSDGGAGIYVATNDTAALSKRFAVFGGDDGSIGLEVVHQPELCPELHSYAMSYDVVIGGFRGDWYTATAMYRTWADRQSWVKESRLKRGLVPDWVLSTALWEWNRGPSVGVLLPAIELQRALGKPVSVFWHWWHGCAYDTGFPEYFPPREGETQFRTAVASARQQGIHNIVYMNQRLWGMTMKSWKDEGAERFAVKSEDGRPLAEVYNVFTKAPCAPMCIGTQFWRDKYAGLATRAVHDFGVDGVYMDQACASLPCYDTTHGHALGGGSYWIEGFRSLEADIRARCASDVPVLAGEGCGEAWLPSLDLMLSLQVSMERYAAPGDWEPLPLFQAVYHDAAVQFGNYSSLTMPPYDELWPAEYAPSQPLALLDQRFSTQFRLEQARAFIWGQQPALANFRPEQLTERPQEIAYVLKLARLRLLWKKYLLSGVFLRPQIIGAPTSEIPISRLSIYAGQQDHLKEYSKNVPMALASAWRAADGCVSIIIASISTTPMELTLDTRQLAVDLPQDGQVYEWDDANKSELGRIKDWVAPHIVQIPAEGVRCFEFVPLH
ncbi:MAG: hypothetical protein HZB26_11425 [Candidatus Hydrogenedentes bacterium]|nr:hypothetical protein [Candidatus Hydrogenedentota bacterium]